MSTQANIADVIVVGLGPTGAALTGLLARRGLRVAAFDRLPDLYPLPRAIGMDHEAMRLFQELGIAERLQPHLAPYRPSEYRGMQGQLIKRLDMAPAPHLLGWAPNWVFDQPALEHVLRQRLAELPTATLAFPCEVIDWRADDDRVQVEARRPDGELEHWSARWLVACDGGSSPIRKRLGIALEDLGFDEPWLVVDAIVAEHKLAELPQTQVQYCEPARPSTFVVGPGQHRRWELMLMPGDSLSEDFPEAELWPLLARWIQPGDARLWRAAAYRFHGLVASRWRQGRVLLAGDAAHMTPPFMAQGMVQGLRDAHNLAWKLERVLRHGADAALLDSYEAERKPHVQSTTRSAIGLGRVICERDPEAAARRDAQMLHDVGGVVPTTVRQSMLPALAGGLVAAGNAGAGSLFPQPWVRVAGDAPWRLLDDVTGAGARVVALAEALDARQADALLAQLAPLQGRLVVVGEPQAAGLGAAALAVQERDGLMASWLRDHGAAFAVARPDHIVHATAPTADAASTRLAELAAALRPAAAPTNIEDNSRRQA
jgi:3-(3-hydroxy-phenyl)propionate hydroxylase